MKESEVKSFTGKTSAIWRKVRNNMMNWRPQIDNSHDSFWSITFTKPYKTADNAEHENDKWIRQIWIWNIAEDKFVAKIRIRSTEYQSKYYTIDYDLQYVAVLTLRHLLIYDFQGNQLKNYEYNSKGENTAKQWQCAFLSKSRFLFDGGKDVAEIDLDNDVIYEFFGCGRAIINKSVIVIHHKESGYYIVVARYDTHAFGSYKIAIWQDYVLANQLAAQRKKSSADGITPLQIIQLEQCAEISLSGDMPTIDAFKVSIHGSTLKVGNSSLCITDFTQNN